MSGRIFFDMVITLFNAFTLFVDGNVNLGLNRPTKQSSIHVYSVNGMPMTADLAVDGNRDNEFEVLSCSHTDHETKPWWEVDLGNKYLIKSVEITNRLFEEPRLLNFKIETSIAREDDGNLVFPKLCFYQRNTHEDGATQNYTCNEPAMARFLRVQLQGTSILPLTLCEVRIFGSATERHWNSVGRNGVRSNSKVLQSTEVSSEIECGLRCMDIITCTSVNVNNARKNASPYICELLQDMASSDLDDVSVSADWVHYVLA